MKDLRTADLTTFFGNFGKFLGNVLIVGSKLIGVLTVIGPIFAFLPKIFNILREAIPFL
jgi:hypothetical protein